MPPTMPRLSGKNLMVLLITASDLVDLVYTAGHYIIAPALATAGIDDQVHILTDICCQHLLQIGSAHAGAGLQVCATHIYHDGNFITAIALDLSILVASNGSYIGV